MSTPRYSIKQSRKPTYKELQEELILLYASKKVLHSILTSREDEIRDLQIKLTTVKKRLKNLKARFNT